ncbi:MAG: hypothetical protein WD876_03850 [Candidatus Pacearchaeota archaeon]
METKINLKAKKEIILILFGVFLIGFISAQPSSGSIPPIPDHFIGNVVIDSQDALVGTQISIYVDAALESVYDITEAGKYDLYVKTGEAGDLIEFKIQDLLAGSSTRQGGETIYLDLIVSTITPPSSNPTGGSGGGSSGSGGSGETISPSSSIDSSPGPEEEAETTQKRGEQTETSSGITGAVIGFLDSGGGIVTIIVILVLGIGVILIKFKAPKWKRKAS